jgi:hypothetical protein
MLMGGFCNSIGGEEGSFAVSSKKQSPPCRPTDALRKKFLEIRVGITTVAENRADDARFFSLCAPTPAIRRRSSAAAWRLRNVLLEFKL